MALFSRKDRNADIEKYITQAVEKAAQSLMGTPMYNQAGYANVVPAQPVGGQGLAQQSGWEAVALPRPGDAFGSMLGPAAPLLPSPIDPVSELTGRAEPRKFQYQVAYNLNLTQQEVPWSVLRSLAEQCDIISRAITIRTADISKMEWSFTLSPDAIQRIMTERNVSHAKAAKIGREEFGEKIDELTAFWRNPYPQSDKGWNQWISESAWNILTFDGWAIYPKYNLGGKVIGFDIIDPSTIKILLDDRGDTPRPPAPAYQQILWGFPRGEFTASPDSDVNGNYYTGVNNDVAYKTDQLSYFIQNRRTYSVYGFSAVEQAIPAATLYLERQRWMIEDFQAGTMPMTFMKTDSTELNHLKLAEFERVFNDKLVGSSEERHKVKVLPKGFDPIVAPSMSERYKPEYDEFIIKRIASIFGVQPSQLGVIARAGLGGGKGQQEGEEQSAETVSTRPMENYIVECINSLCRRYLDMDTNLTFTLNYDTSAMNEETQAKAFQVSLSSGTMTLNDVRGELGQPLYDMPEADEPFILTPQGPVFLKGQLAVDTAGETIGQHNEANPQGAQEALPQVGEEKPREDNRQGKDSQTGVAPQNQTAKEMTDVLGDAAKMVEEELEAFSKFVKARAKKGGAYREFQFKTISEDDAYALNQDAQAILKGDTYTPPKGVQEAAQRALDWIKDDKAGSGFTSVGRKRASDLARGAGVSMTTVRRMKAYFDRHQGDKDATGFKAGEEGYPSPGRVAWDAWGGDAGYSWVKGLVGEEKSEISDTPKGHSLTKEYNPDQPRDEHGRFGSGDGLSSWSPSMTSSEADKWAANSAIQETLYHGTSADSAKAIESNGFGTDKIANGRAYGNGVYLAGDSRFASTFATDGGKTLDLRVNVSNLAPPSVTEQIAQEAADQLGQGRLSITPELGQKMTEIAQSRGYDSLSYNPSNRDDLKPSGYVVFDPKNITVVSK